MRKFPNIFHLSLTLSLLILSLTNILIMVLNEQYFEKIDTKEKAYWLGFLYADGYMTQRFRLGIGIHKDDEILIDLFLQHLEADTFKKRYYRNYAIIELMNKKLCGDLVRHGVVPRKSKIIEFPKLNSRELELTFLLGYFDGDGKTGRTTIVTGSRLFLEQIKTVFQLDNKITIKKRGYEMCLGAELFNAMMDNYKLSLPKKKTPFLHSK